MAKHPVPKKKKPKRHTNIRYGAFKTAVLKDLTDRVSLATCKDCGAKHLNHTVCHDCGKYRGRQVIDKQKKIDKITKVKV